MIFSEIKKIMALATPLVVANFILVTLILVNTSILGNSNPHYFYYLALYMPINYVMLAIYESFRTSSMGITQLCQAKQLNLASHLKSMIVISGLIIFTLLIVCLGIIAIKIIFTQFNPLFYTFVAFSILSSCVVNITVILQASLYYAGYKYRSTSIAITASVLSSCLNYFLLKNTTWGLLCLPLAFLFIYSISSFILYRMINNQYKPKITRQTLSSTLNLLKLTGLPIFSTYVVIFISLAIYNYILSQFSDNLVSGFSLAFRLQNIIMIPAIAIGIATGILFNKQSDTVQNRSQLLKTSLIFNILLYSILSLFFYLFRQQITTIMIHDKHLIETTIYCMQYMMLSYVGLSSFLFYVCFLEQIGQAKKSLILNLIVFVSQILIGGLGALILSNPSIFFSSLIVLSIVSASYVIYSIHYHRYLEI